VGCRERENRNVLENIEEFESEEVKNCRRNSGRRASRQLKPNLRELATAAGRLEGKQLADGED
jgi:hypothetical protein